jgi:polyhydroxyalkanoate synthase
VRARHSGGAKHDGGTFRDARNDRRREGGIAQARRGRGADLARMFAWMRPNDLVWNYVVNNLPARQRAAGARHPVLEQRLDTLAGRFARRFSGPVQVQSIPGSGKLRVRGRKVDLGKVGIDTYVVGGLTDHITTWQGVYRTARLYGASRSTFVLANGGHIQSLINPPATSARGSSRVLPEPHTPDAWVQAVHQKTKERGGRTGASGLAPFGARAAAFAALGSERHPPIIAAPGTYVLER